MIKQGVTAEKKITIERFNDLSKNLHSILQFIKINSELF